MKEQAFSKQSVRRQLSGEGLKPKKSLGQNFLTDHEVLGDIITAAQIDESSCVLEIGPGMGVLTRELARWAGTVVAVEIDTTILPVLQKNLTEFDNVHVINQDILKVNLDALFTEYFGERPVKVIANLPYYITTPIIMKLLEESQRVTSVVVMIQREVGDRLAATAGSKDYGAVTLGVQYRAQVSRVRDVAPECFEPAPKVWSSVIRLDRHEKPLVAVNDEKHFFQLIKGAFLQRRKTFINSVSSFAPLHTDKDTLKQILEGLGLCENIRGEALSMEQFAQISNILLKGKNV